MQGPSEFGVVGNASLKNWDRTKELNQIKVPTLAIGGKHDTMDPDAMKKISESVQHGEFLFCPNGSHMSMYDDQETYYTGVIKFKNEIEGVHRAGGEWDQSWNPAVALDKIAVYKAQSEKGAIFIMKDFHIVLQQPIPRT